MNLNSRVEGFYDRYNSASPRVTFAVNYSRILSDPEYRKGFHEGAWQQDREIVLTTEFKNDLPCSKGGVHDIQSVPNKPKYSIASHFCTKCGRYIF